MILFTLDTILKNKCKTKYWLSKQTNIDNNTLSKIYNNTAKQIKLETLDKLCNTLGCDLKDLIKYIPDKESNNTK